MDQWTKASLCKLPWTPKQGDRQEGQGREALRCGCYGNHMLIEMFGNSWFTADSTFSSFLPGSWRFEVLGVLMLWSHLTERCHEPRSSCLLTRKAQTLPVPERTSTLGVHKVYERSESEQGWSRCQASRPHPETPQPWHDRTKVRPWKPAKPLETDGNQKLGLQRAEEALVVVTAAACQEEAWEHFSIYTAAFYFLSYRMD